VFLFSKLLRKAEPPKQKKTKIEFISKAGGGGGKKRGPGGVAGEKEKKKENFKSFLKILFLNLPFLKKKKKGHFFFL